MKKTLYTIFIILIIIGCSTPNKILNKVYLMENDVSSYTYINGPVKNYSQFTYNVRDSIQFTYFQKFKNRICCNLGGSTRYKGIDSLRGIVKSGVVSYLDTTKQIYFEPVPKTIMGAVFHKKFSIPATLEGYRYKAEYHKDILQPIPIVRNQIRYSKMGENNWVDTNNVSNDTTGGTSYFYEFDEEKYIVKRKELGSVYSMIKGKGFFYKGYYKKVVEFTYNDKNQIISETHRLYEEVEEDFSSGEVFRDGLPVFEAVRIYGLSITKIGSVTMDYTYNDVGLVIKASASVAGSPRFTEEYTYRDDKTLKTKLVYNYKLDYSSRTNAYKSIFHYNEFEFITHLQEYNDKDKLIGEQWMDYYDYDHYNNWARCEIFLSGLHDSKPDVIIDRTYNYFE